MIAYCMGLTLWGELFIAHYDTYIMTVEVSFPCEVETIAYIRFVCMCMCARRGHIVYIWEKDGHVCKCKGLLKDVNITN